MRGQQVSVVDQTAPSTPRISHSDLSFYISLPGRGGGGGGGGRGGGRK